MTSSLWHAHGNEYVVAEGDYEMAGDGALEVERAEGDDVWITIRNPDWSVAEMSGNGTRIAGAWLMERTGSGLARVHVGPRTVEVRRVGAHDYESDLGPVEVFPLEHVAGADLTRVEVGNPHAVVVGDPDDIVAIGPALETHSHFPNRTNVQVVRIDGPGEVTARVWERGVGETAASGSSAVAVAAATHADGDVLVHFPGGDLRVRLADGRAWLTGPAEPLEEPASGHETGTDA
jgi:diaminopimelate epimerase